MRIVFTIISIFFIANAVQNVHAQHLQLLKYEFLNPMSEVSQDRYGNIYVITQGGTIHQFDSMGRKQLIYSPPLVADITLFEARTTVRLFAFYRDLQSFSLLNRFLTPIENYKFDEEKIRFARVANLSADNQVWLVDDIDFSIKKFDKNFNTIALRTPLDLLFAEKEYDINYICEYQNQLFLNDRNTGILVFDNLGNFIRKIELEKGTDYFNFLEEEIYFLENNEIRLIHLYTGVERKMVLPQTVQNQEVKRVLLRKDKLFIFTENELYLFQSE
jgi:hypothetical protein